MKRGVSILFSLCILLILFLLTLSVLLLYQFWEKSSFRIAVEREARHAARTGIANAIWELDHDAREHDCFEDAWRTGFQGDDVDNDRDATPDSRWIPVRDRHNRITARYAVLVQDESAKINANCCGSYHDSSNEGMHTSEIRLLPDLLNHIRRIQIVRFRNGPDGFPGRAFADDDRDAQDLSCDGRDNDGDGLTDEPEEGVDDPDEFSAARPRGDDRPYSVPREVRLASGMGPDSYRPVRNFITTFSYDLNRNRFGKERLDVNRAQAAALKDLFERLGYAEVHAAQMTVNILDYRDRDSIPTLLQVGDRKILGIEQTPYFNEIEALLPWKQEVIPPGILLIQEQGGHFIELFNPYPVPLKVGGWRISGLIVLDPVKIEQAFRGSRDVCDDFARGETAVDPGRVQDIINSLLPTSLVLPSDAEIPPHSYYTIGDLVRIVIAVLPDGKIIPMVLPIHDPDGCDHYVFIFAVNPIGCGFMSKFFSMFPALQEAGLDFVLRLWDDTGHLIEEASYPFDTPFTTVQKNDPRMRSWSDWFPGPASPGKTNIVFQPWIGGEFGTAGWIHLWKSSPFVKNHPLASIAEVSRVHRMEHWRTLDLWRTGEDRKILDHITVTEDPSQPTYGRINLNTASETVLCCLPLVDREIAGAIVNARPFRDIADVLGRPGTGSSPAEELSRAITRYGFDLLDNDRDLFLDAEPEKEMVFSRLVNLVTVRADVFEITVTGQKVSDRNGNGTIEPSEVVAEKRMKAVYDRRRRKLVYRREE